MAAKNNKDKDYGLTTDGYTCSHVDTKTKKTCGKAIKNGIARRAIKGGNSPNALTCYWHSPAGARRLIHHEHAGQELPAGAIKAGHKGVMSVGK